MKRNILILLLILLSPSLFAQENTAQELKVPLSKPGEPGTLNVNLVFGSIKVTGTKGKEVIIYARTGDTRVRVRENIVERSGATEEDKKKTQQEAMKKAVEVGSTVSQTQGLKKIQNTTASLTVTEQNNTVEVTNELTTRPVHLEIQVPTNFNLKLATVNNGNIMISNVNGNFELSNVNGSIILENVSGTAMANTTNGKVQGNIVKWDGKSPMAFSTLNGNIDITLPANAKFNTKLRSDRGEVYTDFDMTRDAAQEPTGSRNEKGLYRVSTADFITGKVNGGGPEIMMKNMNGNIYLRRAGK